MTPVKSDSRKAKVTAKMIRVKWGLTAVQLHRIGFSPRPNLCHDTLTANGREMYGELVRKYGLPV